MKYTVLVVDDEQEQRRALIERVDWDSAGFEVIGEAENGVEALDILEALEPDLILTDIRMPMISGLELAAKVRELRPATQMVVLSGYDSFEYAQTAMNYNIISYLLKPISPDEMSEELFKIHRRMDERLSVVFAAPDRGTKEQLRELSVDNFLIPLMLGSNEEQLNDGELFNTAKKLGIIKEDSTNPRLCVLVTKFKNSDGITKTENSHADFLDSVFSRYMHSESFILYGRAVTLAVTEGEGELSNLLELPLLEIVQTAKRILNQTCTIGVSREFSELSGCSGAYFQAIAARRYTTDGAGEVRFINDQEPHGELEIDRAEKSASKLEQLLKVGGDQQLEEFINGLYESNTPENASLLVMQIIATVYRVVSSASEKSAVSELFSSNPFFARITSYSSESVMKNELISFCNEVRRLISRSQRRDTEILCDRALQIIDERYSDEELSLTGVSNELNVSPNYLSALIKKHKKKNFVTLLTERRMKAAHDMLVCTNMKVLEISEKCGYSDQHYFSYCFKRFYGDSPNKIRTVNRSENQ